jgi:hypothetical protein
LKDVLYIESDTPTTEVQTTILENERNPYIKVCIHKHKSEYSVFVDGYRATVEVDGSLELPAFRTYHRSDARSDSRTKGVPDTGMVTPVSVAVVVEDGERPPSTIDVSLVQRTLLGRSVVHTEEKMGATKLKPSVVGKGMVGHSMILPYPSMVIRKPSIAIKDATALKVARLASSRTSLVKFIKAVVAAVAAFTKGAEMLNLAVLESMGMEGRILDIPYAFTGAMLIDLFVGSGLFSFATGHFEWLLFALNPVANQALASTAVLTMVIAKVVSVIFVNSMSARKPVVRWNYYTIRDIVIFLRTIRTNDAKSTRGHTIFSNEDRVFLSWMLESDGVNTFTRLKKLANTVGEKGWYRTPFPMYGDLRNDGMDVSLLSQHAVELSISIVVTDEQLCNSGKFVVNLKAAEPAALRAGAYQSGWNEDFDEFRKEVALTSQYLDTDPGKIRAKKVIFGTIDKLVSMANVASGSTDLSDVSSVALKSGLDKLSRSIDTQLTSLRKWIASRSDFVSLREGPAALCRVVPFVFNSNTMLVSIKEHASDKLSTAAEGEDNDVGDSFLQPSKTYIQLAFASLGHFSSNFLDAVNFYKDAWATDNRSRHFCVQLWVNPPSRTARRGELYNYAVMKKHSSTSAYSHGLPNDVSFRLASHAEHQRDIQKNMITLITGQDKNDQQETVASTTTYLKIAAASILWRHSAPKEIASVVSLARVLSYKVDQLSRFVDSVLTEIGIENVDPNDEIFLAIPGGRDAFTLLSLMASFNESTSHTKYVALGAFCRELLSTETIQTQRTLLGMAARSRVENSSSIKRAERLLVSLLQSSKPTMPDPHISLASLAHYTLHRTEASVPDIISDAMETVSCLQVFCSNSKMADAGTMKVLLAAVETRQALLAIPQDDFQRGAASSKRYSDDVFPDIQHSMEYTKSKLVSRMVSKDVNILDKLNTSTLSDDVADDVVKELSDAIASVSIVDAVDRYYIPFMHGDGLRTTTYRNTSVRLLDDTCPVLLKALQHGLGYSVMAGDVKKGAPSIQDDFVYTSELLNKRVPYDADPNVIRYEARDETAFVMMSHCGDTVVYSPDTDDCSDGIRWAYSTLQDLVSVLKSARCSTETASGYDVSSNTTRCILWNADRICQAALIHIAKQKTLVTPSNALEIHVYKPTGWRLSAADDATLDTDQARRREALDQHRDRAPAVVVDFFADIRVALKHLQLGTYFEEDTVGADQYIRDDFGPIEAPEVVPPSQLDFNSALTYINNEGGTLTALKTRVMELAESQTYASDAGSEWALRIEPGASATNAALRMEFEFDGAERRFFSTYLAEEQRRVDALQIATRRIEGWRASVQAQEAQWNRLSNSSFILSTAIAHTMIEQTMGNVTRLRVLNGDDTTVPDGDETNALVGVELGVNAAIENGIVWMTLGELAAISSELCLDGIVRVNGP